VFFIILNRKNGGQTLETPCILILVYLSVKQDVSKFEQDCDRVASTANSCFASRTDISETIDTSIICRFVTA